MNFYAIGMLLKRWLPTFAGMFGTGGGTSAIQKDQLIELLREQSGQNNLLVTNHITHLQASLEAQTGTLKEIAHACQETANVLMAIRTEMSVAHTEFSKDLAHISGRMGI